MTNYELKMKVDNCLRLADTITNAGYMQETGMTLREMLKFDLLQFIGFLYETDGSDTRTELVFITDYLGTYLTTAAFLKFRYDRCLAPGFVNTVPRSVTYFVKYDLSGIAKRDMYGRSTSKIVIDLFNDLGAEFILINGATTTQVSNLSNYGLMLTNFLKEFGLYVTGTPGEQIKPSSVNISKLNQRFGNNKKNQGPVNGNNTGTAAKGTVVNASDPKEAPKKKEETPETEEERKKNLDKYLEQLNSLVGLDSVKQDLANLINLIKIRKMREERGMQQPDITLHLVFSGNPGTGKTTVARLLAKIYKELGVISQGQLVEVDRSDLVVGYIGQTAIKTAEVIDSAIGGVLFIDEAYTLTNRHDEKDFGQEAVDTLLKRMEDNRDDLIVIVAGYTDLMEDFVNSNPGLKSRFNKSIFFKDYTGDELFQIFMSMCDKQEYVPNAAAKTYIKAYLTARAKAHEENFANARDARNYIERCIERQASRLVTIPEISDTQLRTLTKEDVKEPGYEDVDKDFEEEKPAKKKTTRKKAAPKTDNTPKEEAAKEEETKE